MQPVVLRQAFFEALVSTGLKPGEAKRQATALASGFMEGPVTGVTAVTGSDSQAALPVSKRETARRLLAENPDWHGLSLRQLEVRTGIDRQSWAVVKAEHNHNGHGPDGEE